MNIMVLRNEYHGITLCISWCYVIHITSFETPFLEPPNSYISYIFDYAMSGNHELLFGGKCSQSLSLDYSSIFQSKFMMKQLFCSKSASTSLHDVISMTHLVRVSIHDIFGHILLPGTGNGPKRTFFCFFTSCLAYTTPLLRIKYVQTIT